MCARGVTAMSPRGRLTAWAGTGRGPYREYDAMRHLRESFRRERLQQWIGRSIDDLPRD
jgi:hypothetical protein